MISNDDYLLVDRLSQGDGLTKEEYTDLLDGRNQELMDYAAGKADEVRRRIYGNKVYTRGIIEFSSYCRNDCFYCGLRRSNSLAERYRLSDEEIFECVEDGYELGYRTLVLQSGEDAYFTDERVCSIVRGIKERHPDCAVTLSIGEKERASYEAYFEAGADRYLLRHESYNPEHYGKIHPPEMSRDHRIQCLRDLKDIGYQVGCGIMVGAPFQTHENIAEDLVFMREFEPHMVGIGPFIPATGTPFEDEERGSVEETLFLLSIIRLILPKVLLPATTALGTANPIGRELGIRSGANVVMPNLSPLSVRKKYAIYDNKLGSDAVAKSSSAQLSKEALGDYELVSERGDYIDWSR
ncbi:MAG: [FeFe] hydrogenase H-cluster radical SAM maturase HydE [Eubacterium sp.]|nr:[FeFe] hydrogenase H-cluster radical SAM maturase HydE [Eubacterium sp.]